MNKIKVLAFAMSFLLITLMIPTRIVFAQEHTIRITSPVANEEKYEDFDLNVVDGGDPNECSYKVNDGPLLPRQCSGTFFDSTVTIKVGDSPNDECKTHGQTCSITAISRKILPDSQNSISDSVNVFIDIRGCAKVSARGEGGSNVGGTYDVIKDGNVIISNVALDSETGEILQPGSYQVKIKSSGYGEKTENINIEAVQDPGVCEEKTVNLNSQSCSETEQCMEGINNCGSIGRGGTGLGCVSDNRIAGVCCTKGLTGGADLYTKCPECTRAGGTWCETDQSTQTSTGNCIEAQLSCTNGNAVQNQYLCKDYVPSPGGTGPDDYGWIPKPNPCEICIRSAPNRAFCQLPNEDFSFCIIDQSRSYDCSQGGGIEISNTNSCPKIENPPGSGSGGDEDNSIFNSCQSECIKRASQSGKAGWGYCSVDRNVPTGMTIPLTGVNQPSQIGKGVYACTPNEYCWCVSSTLNIDVNIPNNNPYRQSPSPTSWEDPDILENPSTTSANPPVYDCSNPSGSNINAQIRSNTVQVGDQVVVSGIVGKISNQCKGFQYTCRTQRILTCKENNGFFSYSLEAPDCPDGTASLHVEGEESKTKWGNIISITLLAISTFVILFPGAAGSVLSSLGLGNEAGAAVSATAKGKEAASAAYNAAIVAGEGTKAASAAMANAAISTYNAEYAAYLASSALQRTQAILTAANGFNQAFQRNSVSQLPPCFRVCGKDFQSTASNAPTCRSTTGQAGYPVAETEATYSCSQSTATACEGFAGKRVRIEVKDFRGSIIKTAEVVTDAQGKFDYTFTAPGNEGRYNAVVSLIS